MKSFFVVWGLLAILGARFASADQALSKALERLGEATSSLQQSSATEEIKELAGDILEAVRALQTRADANSTPEYVASLDGDRNAVESGELGRLRLASQDLRLKASHAQNIVGIATSIGARVRLTVRVSEKGKDATDCL